MTEGADCLNFDYGATGNLWVTTACGSWAPGSFTPRTANWYNVKNQLVGVGYDGSGNQTALGAYVWAYDAENRLKSSTLSGATTTYAYDGEGRRVKRGSTVLVYDAFGNLAAEYGGTAEAAGTQYLTADHLGSTRMVTNGQGTVTWCGDYLPFGEELPAGTGGRAGCYGGGDGMRVKFTGKERDGETGLDYFGARYFSGAQGRFTSPDPVHFQVSMLEDPQRFNLYAYVRNSPLRFVDPKGEAIELIGDEEERRKALDALKVGVGRRAAQYLYENKVETKSADGTTATKYYVGVLSGGPSGKGPAFEKLSTTTAALGAIINDPQIATLQVVGAADPVPQLNKYGGSLYAYGAVGASSPIGDRPPIWVVAQDPSTGKYPTMPGWNMTSGRDAPMGIVDTTFHELGHAWWLMDFRAGRNPSDTSNQRAVELENQIRRARQPQFGERINH